MNPHTAAAGHSNRLWWWHPYSLCQPHPRIHTYTHTYTCVISILCSFPTKIYCFLHSIEILAVRLAAGSLVEVGWLIGCLAGGIILLLHFVFSSTFLQSAWNTFFLLFVVFFVYVFVFCFGGFTVFSFCFVGGIGAFVVELQAVVIWFFCGTLQHRLHFRNFRFVRP